MQLMDLPGTNSVSGAPEQLLRFRWDRLYNQPQVQPLIRALEMLEWTVLSGLPNGARQAGSSLEGVRERR